MSEKERERESAREVGGVRALARIVNGLLDEPELGQQLCARVPAQGHRPGICDLWSQTEREGSGFRVQGPGSRSRGTGLMFQG